MAWNKYLKAEVPLLSCIFWMILQSGVLQNLYIFRTCYVILGYNESDCAQLGKETNNMTQYLEQKAQPIVNQIQMGIDIVTFFALFFCVYVGIWSDKFGRKPFLLLCLFGNTMNSIFHAILMFFHYVSPWWLLTCQVPLIFTGNFATLFIILTTYITDVTTASDRMIRMALFQVIFGIGQFLGSFLLPYIFYGTSYEFVFCLTSSLLLFTLVYAYFFIPESLPKEKEKFEIKNLLKYINFLEILNTAFKQRPHNGRLHILLTIGIIVVTGFASGEISVVSLFLRVKFGWTLTKVSMFNSVTCVALVIATALGTFIFYEKLKIKEIPLALVSCLICMVANLLRAFAVNDYYIYIAAGINLFSVLGSLMMKTLLTFMVAPEEMGKIISLLDISLSLTGTLANFIYPLVYRSTIDINPAIYNYISLGGNAIGAIGSLFLLNLELPYYAPAIGNEEFIKSNKTIPYEQISGEENE